MTITFPIRIVAWLRPRFSLRAFLVTVTVLSVVLAWYGNWRSGKIREHSVERRLIELGGDTRTRMTITTSGITACRGRPGCMRRCRSIVARRSIAMFPLAALKATR
jgi:hypothetical protein